MISKEQVQHVAKLARLGLRPPEIKKMQKELSAILDYIKLLEEVDILQVEPTSLALSLKNIMRKDEVKEEEVGTLLNLMKAVPARKREYVKVKAIL